MGNQHNDSWTGRRSYLAAVAGAGLITVSGCTGFLEDDDDEPLVEEPRDDEPADDDTDDQEDDSDDLDDDDTDDSDDDDEQVVPTFYEASYTPAEIPVLDERWGIENTLDEPIIFAILNGGSPFTNASYLPVFDVQPGEKESFSITEDNTNVDESDVPDDMRVDIELLIRESDYTSGQHAGPMPEMSTVADHVTEATWSVENSTSISDPREASITDGDWAFAPSDTGISVSNESLKEANADEVVMERFLGYWNAETEVTLTSVDEEETLTFGYPDPPTDVEINATAQVEDDGEAITVEQIDVTVETQPTHPIPRCLAVVTTQDDVFASSDGSVAEPWWPSPALDDPDEHDWSGDGDPGKFGGYSNMISKVPVVPFTEDGGAQLVENLDDFSIQTNAELNLPADEDGIITVTLNSWDAILDYDRIPVTEIL